MTPCYYIKTKRSKSNSKMTNQTRLPIYQLDSKPRLQNCKGVSKQPYNHSVGGTP